MNLYSCFTTQPAKEHAHRVIAHLDADAFFASVEQAADPRLRGKAVAVGGEPRGIIASASYEARRHGVYTPMPTVRARKLCPWLIVLPGDFEKYERFSRWMFSYVYDFTPDVEIGSIDEGYFDLSGAWKRPAEIARTIRRAIGQSLKISVSEGLGPNKLISQIASKLRKPAALLQVPAGQERAFLHPLPNRWLPGVGPQTATRLTLAGLPLIRQIARMPADRLALILGNRALQIRAFANGIDHRPLVRETPAARSYGQQHTFSEDVTDEPLIEMTLKRMVDDLMRRVRADGKSIRTITVRVRYNDMAEDQRSDSLTEPTDLESDVYAKIKPMLRAAWKRRVSLRLVGLRFSHVYDSWQRQLTFNAAAPVVTGNDIPGDAPVVYETRRRLATVIDRLREAHGRYVVMRGDELAAQGRPLHADDLTGATLPIVKAHPVRHRHAPRRLMRRSSRTESFSRHGPMRDVLPPLRVRSYYSFLDSTLSPRAIVDWAAAHDLPAIALTDTGNLHGAVEFVQAAKKAGIRPLLGAELTINGCQMLAYVKNTTGYQNLCRLLSSSSVAGNRSDETDGLIIIPADTFPAVHYGEADDRWQYDIVQSIRTRTLLRQPHPQKRLGGLYHFPSDPRRAQPTTIPGITREIIAACTFDLSLGTLQFPAFHPADGSSPHGFLRRLVLDGMRRRYRGADSTPTQSQVDLELSIIADVGYEEYFLVVWDILQACRRRGIDWITRGSAADSLVCYCLGISDVCPIRFDLYFRRFLNKDRMALNKLPDIDIDFPHDRKDDVIDLIFEKYGTDHAAVVGGFSTFRVRSAFAEVAKVLGLSDYQARRFTERLPHVAPRHLEQALAERPDCRELPLNEEPYRTAVNMAAFLDGFPRYAKMHPCGVVLSRVPITNLVPCFTANKGYPTTHFDMDAVEAIGLVKIDILAQGGLAVMRDTLAAADDHRPCLPTNGSSFNDPAVWEMIASGGARAVHHIESPAMISLCRMTNVREIDGLIAIVSVIRPGAANEGKKQSFTRRYQGLEPVTYPHPSLEDCLRGTFGLVVYEEHILQICDRFAGLSPGRADVLRRALNREQWDVVEIIGREFAAAARQRGRADTAIRKVWQLICSFSGYAFCKAHSTAYGVEAYQSAWLKTYDPAAFMAAVLSNGKGFYRPIVYVLECHRLGIPMLPPTINAPGPGFTVVRPHELQPSKRPATVTPTMPAIRVPAVRVSGLRETTVKRMIRERDAQGPFVGITDFAIRVGASRDELERLMQVGAFDTFGTTRPHQFWEIQTITRAGHDPSTGQLPMADPAAGIDTPAASLLTPPSRLDRLRAEMELLGFPVSGHPLELYPNIAWDTYVPITRLGDHVGQTVTTCGLIVQDRVHCQVTGGLMKFMTIADRTGLVETDLFAETYKSYGLATVRYPLLQVTARVEPYENGNGYSLRVLQAGKPRIRHTAVPHPA